MIHFIQLLMCGMRKYSVADLKTNHVVTGTSPTFRRVSQEQLVSNERLQDFTVSHRSVLGMRILD